MRINVLTSFAGFVILIAGLYCPILSPLNIHNIDTFDANKPYGMVLLLIAVVGIITTVLNQPKVTKLASFILLALAVLFYVAVWFKVHTSFSFIPFRSIAAFFTRKIVFKWGWYLLFAGPLVAVAGVIFGRKPAFTNNFDAPVKQN